VTLVLVRSRQKQRQARKEKIFGRPDIALVNGNSAFADVDLRFRQMCIVEALSYVLSLMLIDRKLILIFRHFSAFQYANPPHILLEAFRVKCRKPTGTG
jgi:hypothetical protein